MDDFVAINSVYARYFGTSPPARATVAVDLPADCAVEQVMLVRAVAILFCVSHDRRARASRHGGG